MLFDLDTLFFTTVFTSAVAGCLLLLTWSQHRDVAALALWGGAFMFGAVGIALITMRGTIPEPFSIVAGNTALALGYGVGWLGVRKFEGRPPFVPAALAGAAIWLAACAIDEVYARPYARAGLMVAIVSGYSLLNAWEFYRSRDTGSMSRWPIIIILLLHAAFLTLRIPLAETWPLPDNAKSPLGWHVVVALEAVLAGFCVAYLLGGMARERIALKFQQESLADPLTGVANRRAFFDQGDRLLRRLIYARRPAALVVFDLDRFKQINDTFGHPVGDQVLRVFCDMAAGSLRPGDLFARIGGEEFACLLVDAPRQGAQRVAERIRERTEATELASIAPGLAMTVSAGVAVAELDQDLVTLVAVADRALYRAKKNGRNRVEIAPPRLAVVGKAAS